MNDNHNYITLNGTTVANYAILFQLKKDISVSLLTSKQQISAKRFQLFNQQNNLIFVDMIFPNILADIALEVYFGNTSTFAAYMTLPKTYTIINEKQDTRILNIRIRKFIEFILFSDIQTDKLSSGELNYNQYFRFTDDSSILFYSNLNYTDLIELCFERMKLTIDHPTSTIINNEIVINLQISL
ncbi:MAG: hypothetical protein ACOYM7_10000 [Paludibacter sp.]